MFQSLQRYKNMDHLNRALIVYGLRLVCLLLFVTSTFDISPSWKSLMTLLALLGSIYFLPLGNRTYKQTTEKTKDIVKDLYPKLTDIEEEKDVTQAVSELVLYDAENTPSLDNFDVIKKETNCIFARKANIWGSPEWNKELSLEENIFRLLPAFLKFTIVCRSRRLDAFLVELPGSIYGQTVESFGNALRLVLKTISDHDPAGIHCMNKTYLGKRGWVFEFNKITFFITTFAPFYPENHARYSFGADNCYILFQPELSFAFHDLPADSAATNWEEPVTVRDKIRIAYRDAGRPYHIPESVSSPMTLQMLRPVEESDPVYEWWKHGNN